MVPASDEFCSLNRSGSADSLGSSAPLHRTLAPSGLLGADRGVADVAGEVRLLHDTGRSCLEHKVDVAAIETGELGEVGGEVTRNLEQAVASGTVVADRKELQRLADLDRAAGGPGVELDVACHGIVGGVGEEAGDDRPRPLLSGQRGVGRRDVKNRGQ